MIDHVSIGVRAVATTKRFYDAALKPLGYQCLSEGKDSLGYGRGTIAFWISSPTTSRTPTHRRWRSRLPVFLAACPLRRRAD